MVGGDTLRNHLDTGGVVKNLSCSTSVRVWELLQPAPAKAVEFSQRFQSDFYHRLHVGFFVDEKPTGIVPAETVTKV
jgi:hypothetical protein